MEGKVEDVEKVETVGILSFLLGREGGGEVR